MVVKWDDKGCAICRKLWESGKRPPELTINFSLHSRLHKCAECGAYWEQLERYADVIDEREARGLFPEVFRSTGENNG